MEWRTNLTACEWDDLLAKMGGHPLQSALWGDAKKAAYGIEDQRFCLFTGNEPIALVRVEKRGFVPFTKCAWIPQGPTLSSEVYWSDIKNSFYNQLKIHGFWLSVTSPWKAVSDAYYNLRKTIWIDLQQGKETLWLKLDKQWRYGVRSARRLNAKISLASSEFEFHDFFKLCSALSHKKNFSLPYKKAFIRYFSDCKKNDNVDVKLFLVKHENEIGAGALVFRVGKNIHYMAGAVNRKYSKLRFGELIQWKIIEWGCDQGCVQYDLEGIDKHENSGVAVFKKKMGGEVVCLEKPEVQCFNFFGKIIHKFIRNKLC